MLATNGTVVLGALLAGVANSPGEGDATPPNVLILLADDLGVDSLGVYGVGSDLPTTPNLDALAASGLVYERAWSNPLCSPTRAALLTGRHAFRTGVGYLVEPGPVPGPGLPLSEWTLPELLDLGAPRPYAHAAFGKWHLGNDSLGGDLAPNLAGFGHYAGSLGNLMAPFGYYSWPKVVDGVASVSTAYATTDTVDSTLAWVASVQEPWLAYVAFHAPHDPFHDPPAALHSVDLTEPNDRKRFKAMVEAMDTEIGRLLASLDPEVRARTMVIFLGDNGTKASITVPPFDPNHAKQTLYQGGVHVPLLVDGPLVTAPSGSRVDALVDATDLVATVLEIAEVDPLALPPGAAQDSTSFAATFTDPAAPSPAPYAYAEVFRPNGPRARPSGFLGLSPFCAPTTCGGDMGFGGPGGSTLEICGGPVFGGYLDGDQDPEVRLQGAPPLAPGFLYASKPSDPMALFGGTLAAWPPSQSIPIQPDAAGALALEVDPAALTVSGFVLYQAVLTDGTQPAGFAVSNAVAAQVLGTDMETVRSQRYKLIVDNNTCVEAFFDLELDPFETEELLAGGALTPQESAAYLGLKQALFALRDPVPPLRPR